MAVEALGQLRLAVHSMEEGGSGDIGLLLACDLCLLAARHTTVYEAVSIARSSGSESIKG